VLEELRRKRKKNIRSRGRPTKKQNKKMVELGSSSSSKENQSVGESNLVT